MMKVVLELLWKSMKKALGGATLVMILWSVGASACRYDTDCSVGSRCVKGTFDQYGYCGGGSNPGNSSDRNPVFRPTGSGQAPSGSGRTCVSDFQCGVGGRCLKEGFNPRGVCL